MVGDPAELIELIDAVGERSVDHAAASRFLSDPSSVAVGGYLDDTAAGYLIAYLVTRIDGHRMLIVYDVAVAAPSRRRGVASRMIATALERASVSGASKAWVVADGASRPALALYHSTGAVPSDGDDRIMWWPMV
jgi:GNAT superfamily N-acetyltransferase